MMGGDCLGDVNDMLTMCNRRILLPDDIKTVVITAFNDPYENSQENPSSEVLDELMSNSGKHIQILPHKIPTTFEAADKKVPELTRIWPQTDCLGEPADMLTMCNKGTVTGQDAKTVVITAFENRFFKFWKKNPSEAVLDELLKSPRKNIKIVPIKIKSTFEAVDEKVPELRKSAPEIILHLAAHSTLKVIYLETKAFSDGYSNPLDSTVDFEYILDELNEKCGLKIEKSANMERSIENYLYSMTLCASSQKTLLIRIPPFDDEYTKEAITSVVREIMRTLTRD